MPADTQTSPAALSGTITLGRDLTVNRLGYGAMRITGKGIWGPPDDRDAAIATLRRAVELGVNFIDTADSYGPFVSEELIAEALAPYPAGLVITTKVGWTRHGAGVWQHNATPAHIAEAVEGSLKRLGLDCIDVYQLHVPDPATSFDASMEAMARLKEQGKVRHVALSNVTLEHIQRAEKIVPIVLVQNRYSFSDREWDYVLDYCQASGIAFLPWGPMAQGKKANEVVERIAAARQTSTGVVSLAWLLRRSPVMLPIPGTGNVKHLEENVSAAGFQLADDEFADLNAVVPQPYWLRA
ncbi:MAG TPA: aldo/keto reductase [Terracidiphilus sp.]|jgi:aryl-alcohol dehydrogenase-like predicted oxidoreductase|nr:aldo/keto reductase [Terracidiphilus sp.]